MRFLKLELVRSRAKGVYKLMAVTIHELLIFVPPILLLEGFFSGSEIALLSADKLALKRSARHGHRGATLALELSSQPERVLSTTLLMTSLCVITISAIIELYFFGNGYRNADLLAVLVTSPLIVILGELVPKTIYQRQATRISAWVAYPISFTYWIFFPITRFLSSYVTRLSRLMGPVEELLAGKKKNTREDLRSMLSYTRKESEIKASEKRIIKRIFDFKDSEAKHALIPLVKVDAIEESSTIQEALEKFEQHRHSRMPVYSERIDNIVGVLEISDLFASNDIQLPLRNYISPAHYVAETQSLDDLLLEMRTDNNEMVVVVDEHGGAVGVITFEDIVEEIVGEISDEYDADSRLFKVLDEDKWLIQARMEITELNEELKLDLPDGDYETLSGFLLQQFGRIPESRNELFFNTSSGQIKFTVQNATQRHIESVIVEKLSE